jgi:hypothetical protein
MTEEQKQRIDHYIQLWISEKRAVSNDAGWQGCGTMGQIQDFLGCLPTRAGNDQSNLAMIKAMRLRGGTHKKMPVIACAVTTMWQTNSDEMDALMAKHALVGLCANTGAAWTDKERANRIGQSIGRYRHNLRSAYRTYQRELDAAERFMIYFGLAE